MKNWTTDIDQDGIALILLDMPGRSMNTLSESSLGEFFSVVESLKSDDAIRGAVIASGKPGIFCAGRELTDIDRFAGPPDPADAQQVYAADIARMTKDHTLFRRLETCGKPVACAIEGQALGAGAELALACHYRVAAESKLSKFGLPEVTLGLLPGSGGTQRLPRLIGIGAALKMLLDGKPIGAAEAHSRGIVDELAPEGAVVAAAKRWVKEAGDPIQPWDRKGFRIPGGAPYDPGVADAIAVATALSRKQYFGNYLAQETILAAVYEGAQVPFDAALRVESRYFVRTVRSPQTKAMIRTLFLSPKEIKNGANRPTCVPVRKFRKAAVLGAGLMGGGIAYVQAAAGIETVLLDVSQEAADKGKAYSVKVAEKAVSRGEMTHEQAAALLSRILPTTDYSNIAGADIVVEAVFEDRAVKADVTRRAEAQLGSDGIMASNTSTLPITGLAKASVRPEKFIGLHFFSPVERMDLVEIIRGDETSDETLAAAFDYVAAIRKTPIVVKDSRGFYTSRTITKYLEEPCEMLMEGIAPAIIENIGRMAGMPVAPLALVDAIGLELPYHVLQQTRADLGDDYRASAVDSVLRWMVVEHQRFGRKNGKGFYDYADDGHTKFLSPRLAELAKPTLLDASDVQTQRDLKNRILYSMSLEAAKCMEAGIIVDPREADVGALLGFGFPSWTGGPISLIEQVGIGRFVVECDRLADLYGERFRPSPMLREMAERGQRFYGRQEAA